MGRVRTLMVAAGPNSVAAGAELHREGVAGVGFQPRIGMVVSGTRKCFNDGIVGQVSARPDNPDVGDPGVRLVPFQGQARVEHGGGPAGSGGWGGGSKLTVTFWPST